MSMYRFKCFSVGGRMLHWALLLLVLALISPAPALYAAPQAQIPSTINYQGTLRDVQGNLVTGERDMTFRIYVVGTKVPNETVLHTETITGIPIRDGIFNVVLGEQTPFAANVFAEAPRYIGITVAPEAEEMVPRQRLYPVPWAQLATSATNAVNAANATNAANAATATTLVPNATLNGGLSIANSPFTLNTGNWYWDVQTDSAGTLRFVSRNVGALRLSINPNGNVLVPGDFNTRSVALDSGTTINGAGANIKGNIQTDGKVIAALGFNGKCANVLNSVGAAQFCDQDIAETFGTDARTEPGDLVVLIPEDREIPAVQLSTQPYAAAIVGVVSTKPGLVFDQGETILAGDTSNLITDEKTVVAMVGRVPAKFSLENGPIAVGDPLTSSSTPGAAMKATQAGRIIGYALQSSDAAADGKILVWLQLSTHIPEAQLAMLNSGTPAATSQSSPLPWGLPLFGGIMIGGLFLGNSFLNQRSRRREQL